MFLLHVYLRIKASKAWKQYSLNSSSSTLVNFTTRGISFCKCSPENHKTHERLNSLKAKFIQFKPTLNSNENPDLTDSMAALSTDGRQALDVRPRHRGGRVLGQLAHQVFGQLGEEGGATAGHQVSESQDGAFPDRHSGTGELRDDNHRVRKNYFKKYVFNLELYH